MRTPDVPELFNLASDAPPPTPWTPEQIAAWNTENGALKAGEAIAFEQKRAVGRARLRSLKTKGVAQMTPVEKDEVLTLLLERML